MFLPEKVRTLHALDFCDQSAWVILKTHYQECKSVSELNVP